MPKLSVPAPAPLFAEEPDYYDYPDDLACYSSHHDPRRSDIDSGCLTISIVLIVVGFIVVNLLQFLQIM